MVFSRAEHVAWRNVGGETIVVNLKSNRLYVLNASGGFFWHALDGVKAVDDVVALVPVAGQAGEVESALRGFFSELAKCGLVEQERPTQEGETLVAVLPFPGDSFSPPEIVWQEEIRNFGVSCAFIGGQSEACGQAPTM